MLAATFENVNAHLRLCAQEQPCEVDATESLTLTLALTLTLTLTLALTLILTLTLTLTLTLALALALALIRRAPLRASRSRRREEVEMWGRYGEM